MRLAQIYERLLVSFGPQGWWPASRKFSPAEWEICVGAVLTQNTNWSNVDKALDNMKANKITSVSKVLYCDGDMLEQAVRPSGFYRQKAGRLKELAEFVADFGGFREFSRTVMRKELLGVKGLGPETVDSIMLYALGRPVFVVDAYTKRVFTRFGFALGSQHAAAGPKRRNFSRSAPQMQKSEEYELWRWFFESTLPKGDDREKQVKMYKEFHALIVELAKRHCKAKPACARCPLEPECRKHF